MSAELIGILGVGLALATFIRVSLKDVRGDLTTRMDRMEQRFEQRFEQIDARLARLEHGQAKLEGLLDGLREAIAGRRVSGDAA